MCQYELLSSHGANLLFTDALSPRQDLFTEHLSTFFVRFSEPVEGRQARVRILVALANESNIRTILSELLVRTFQSSPPQHNTY